MAADPSTELVRAAITRALALRGTHPIKVKVLALAGASLPAAGTVRSDLLDVAQPEGWGSRREVGDALLGSRGAADSVRSEIIMVDDSPRLGWEDSWTE
jgi:hypothetical protein